MAFLLYSIFIEGGIFISHGIWLFRTRKLRKIAKLAGKSFDDLPESEEYHIDAPRKGSIAASRDMIKDQIERKGSVALAQDLERGEEMLPESVSGGRRSGSLAKPIDTVSKVISTKTVGVMVNEEEIMRERINTTDYGTVARSAVSGSKARPGYVRQDSNVSSLTLFKDPEW